MDIAALVLQALTAALQNAGALSALLTQTHAEGREPTLDELNALKVGATTAVDKLQATIDAMP